MQKSVLIIVFVLAILTATHAQTWSYKTYDDGRQGTFIDDRDGQEYDWVRIGTQYWMAQNLNVGKIIYLTNSKITDVSIERFCFDYRQENCARYGGLYPNYLMKDFTRGEKSRSICPEGWHLPSESEWMTLVDRLGGMETAGGALKRSGIRKWSGPDSGLADSVGFNALPAGYAGYSKYTYDEEGLLIPEFQIAYLEEGKACYFWSSTETGTLLFPRNDYKAFGLTGKRSRVEVLKGPALGGYSVRCVR